MINLVSCEVLCCANEFMTLIQEDVDSIWFESFENIYDSSPETIEDWFMYQCEENILEQHIYSYTDKKISDDYTLGMALDDMSTIDKDELAKLCGFEANLCEIYEYWLVSEWLSDQLNEFQEPIAKNFYGFNVWGRTCTGQSITLDRVFSSIVEVTGYNGWTH